MDIQNNMVKDNRYKILPSETISKVWLFRLNRRNVEKEVEQGEANAQFNQQQQGYVNPT